MELAREAGAEKVVPLQVGAAFHSELMKPTPAKMDEATERFPGATPACRWRPTHRAGWSRPGTRCGRRSSRRSRAPCAGRCAHAFSERGRRPLPRARPWSCARRAHAPDARHGNGRCLCRLAREARELRRRDPRRKEGARYEPRIRLPGTGVAAGRHGRRAASRPNPTSRITSPSPHPSSGLPIRRFCLEGPMMEAEPRTEVAQPALFAVSLALTDAARARGLEPDFRGTASASTRPPSRRERSRSRTA